jgi:hypothetical protein
MEQHYNRSDATSRKIAGKKKYYFDESERPDCVIKTLQE